MNSIFGNKVVKTISFIFCVIFTFYFFYPVTSIAETEEGGKIAVIGSSTYAAGCNKNWGVIKRLKNSLPKHKIDCFVKSSTGHKWFLDQFNDKVKGRGYDDLIIYSGLNFMGSTKAPDKSKDSFKKILQQAELEGIRTIVTGAQPFANYKTVTKEGKTVEWTKLWGKNVRDNALWLSSKPYGLDVFVDIYPYIEDGGQGMQTIYDSGDGLHMNSEGHKLLHQLIMVLAYGDKKFDFDGSIVVSDLSVFGDIELKIEKPQTKIKIPGLDFSNPENLLQEEDEVGSKFILIPYLGEYLAAIYRYAVVIISIIAVVMIIDAGFQYIISSGNSEKITKAKDKIIHSITALILAVGSYTLLYTINPELVKFKNLRILTVQGLPLDILDKGQPLKISSSSKSSTGNATYDSIFQKYESCLDVDWKILKAVAYRESRLNPDAVSDTGYKGLFQTTKKNCEGNGSNGYLGKYGLSDYCEEITDPEVSTMVGASSLRASYKLVEKVCPKATNESKVFFMYTGHHSGLGGAKNIMTKLKIIDPTCDWNKAHDVIYDMWIKHEFKNPTKQVIMGEATKAGDEKLCNTINPKTKRKYYCAKRHTNDGFKGGKGVIDTAKSLGSTFKFKDRNDTKCPLIDTDLITKKL